MELGSDGLKVFYSKDAFVSRGHAMDFERELDALCKRYGLHRWASGKEWDTDIRVIAYDRAQPQ